MTKFALVRLLKTFELKIVKTKDIGDFNTYLVNPEISGPYLVCDGKWRKSCSILIVGESIEDVKDKQSKKRLKYPKINDSDILDDHEITQSSTANVGEDADFDGTTSGDDDKIKDSGLEKKPEKRRYPTDGESSASEADDKKKTTKVKKPEKRRYPTDGESSDSEADDKKKTTKVKKTGKRRFLTDEESSDGEVDVKKKTAKTKKIQIQKKESAKTETADKIVEAYKKSRANAIPQKYSGIDTRNSEKKINSEPGCSWYDDDKTLKNKSCKKFDQRKERSPHSPPFPYDDSPVREMRSPEKSSPVYKSHLVRNLFYKRDKLPDEPVNDRMPRGGNVNDHMYDLGDGVMIKESCYEKAKRANDASKFITTLAYGIWGYETLANRCVSHRRGMPEMKELTPKKVVIITKKFDQYLRKRQCDRTTHFLEMSKVNRYLGRAIGGARKHIGNSKKEKDGA